MNALFDGYCFNVALGAELRGEAGESDSAFLSVALLVPTLAEAAFTAVTGVEPSSESEDEQPHIRTDPQTK